VRLQVKIKVFRRVTAIIMLICIVASFTSCSKNPSGGKDDKGKNTGSSSTEGQICIPYSREDGMNPFTAKSLLNSSIMPLLYSGLFSLNEKYEAEDALGKDAVVSGTEVTVTMDSGARFSDGSTVTADDVVYSFNLSKNSVYYSTMLLTVESVVAAARNKVVFKMAVADKYSDCEAEYRS